MNPIATAILLIVLVGTFIYSARKRWKLMFIGGNDLPTDNIGARFNKMLKFAIGQGRMPRYRWVGIAHILIYVGGVVMGLRALILFARGFVDDPNFGFVIFDQGENGTLLGNAYVLVKDILVIAVLLGVATFFYVRLKGGMKRMTLGFEGYLVLTIITLLMLTDVLYDGASVALAGHGSVWEPLGSGLASALKGQSEAQLATLQQIGFFGHITLILLFLNYLPYCKQFHEITSFPNVFFSNIGPIGKLPTTDDIEGRLEREEPLGAAKIDHFGAKAMMDFYTCTECGRCTDQCPANSTGKLLSPKQLTMDLRDFAYQHQDALIAGGNGNAAANGNGENGNGNGHAHEIDLVPGVIKPEVLWACTTCGACEQECPVFISYVDKIVDMRRHLVQEKAEFPTELQNMFRGLETNSNPWSFPASDRAAWANGLDVPFMADNPEADVLFWVGCSASYDDRARKIARATASLLKKAGVNFAILGEEEQCTGDPARRAGNEFLFQMLAQMNAETLNNYKPKTIVTSCPHCFNTLAHEYPDFDAKFDVVHHSVFLSKLVKEGKLQPKNTINKKVAYHDSCYLGRYNDVYEPPRETLRSIPGLKVLEPAETRDRGMCCGAGGAQMFKEEEEGSDRVNIRRTEQLLATKPDTIASSCPFCQRMLIDGLAAKDASDVGQMDIAELLWQSVEPAAQAQGAPPSPLGNDDD